MRAMKWLAAALLLAAALGAGAWYKLTAFDRNLAAFKRGEDRWAWLIENKNDERVASAVRESLAVVLSKDDPGPLDAWSTFFKERHADTTQAGIAYAKFHYVPALTWAGDDAAAITSVEGLRWLASQPVETVEATLPWLLPAQPPLTSNKQWLSDAMGALWLRFGTPTTVAWYQRLSPREQADLVRDALVLNRNFGDEGLARAYAELLRLAANPESRLIEVLGGEYGDRPETVRFFRSWGPGALRTLTELSGAKLSTAEQTARMTALLSALDIVPPAAPGAVADALDEYLRGKTEPATLGLTAGLACNHSFPPGSEKVFVYRLAKLPADQLLGVWETDGRPAQEHLAARALARVDPSRMAGTLHLELERFAPLARVVEANRLRPELVPEADAKAFQALAPAVWEGVAALAELDEVPRAAVEVLWEAAGSPSAPLADRAAQGLDKVRDTQRFVEGLFTHLSTKESEAVDELDRLTSRLTAHADAGPFIVRALNEALEASDGHPERMRMAQKFVGIKALAKLKTPSAKPTLKQFLNDPSTYVEDKVTKGRDGKVRHEQVERSFSSLVKQALK